MSSEVGSGHVSIFPVMTGFKKSVSKEVGAAGTAGKAAFGSGFKGAGSQVGASLGKDMKSSFVSSAGDLAGASVSKLQGDVAKASRAMTSARLSQQDAAGRVRVAETQLSAAMAKYPAGASQVVAAEERVASMRRKAEVASTSLATASGKLATAQGALSKAQVAVGAGMQASASGAASLGSGITSGLSGAGAAASRVVSSVSAMAAGFAVVGAAAAAGIGKAVSSFVGYTAKVVALQRVTGGTMDQVSSMRSAMMLSGMDADSAGTSMTIFSKKLEAVSGDSGKAAEMSKQLGVDVLDSAGNIKPMNDILPQVADKFKSMPDGIEKTALATQLFGRSGTSMLPFLNKGSAGIAALEKRSRELHLTLTELDKTKFANFKTETRNISSLGTGLQNSVGSAFIPAVTGIVHLFGELLEPAVANITRVMDGAAPYIQKFGDYLSAIQIPASGISGVLTGMVPIVGSVAGAFAMVSHGGAIVDLLSKVPMLGGVMTSLSGTLGKLGPSLDGAGSGFEKTGSKAKKMGSLFGMIPGPLKAVGLGILAVGAGAVIFSQFGDQINGVVAQIPGMVAGFTAAIPGIVSSITGAIPGIVSAITTTIPQLVMTIVTMLQTSLPAIVSGAVSLLMGIVQAVGQIIPPLVAAIPPLITSLVSALTSLLPVLLQGAIGLLMGIVQAVTQVIPPLVAAIPPLITSLVGGLMSMLPMLLQSGVQLLMSLVQGIMTALPQIMTAYVQIVTTLVTGIVTMLPQIIEAGIQLLMALISGIVQMLPQLISSGIQLIMQLIGAIIQMLPQIIEAGIQLLMSLISGIVQMLPQLISSGIQLIMQLIGSIIQMLPQIIVAGIQLIIALVGGLVSAIPKIIQALPQIFTAIKQGFSGVDWGEVGSQLIDGIKNGIVNAAHRVVDAAKEAAQKALDGVKNLLGIHSPSRVFRDQVGSMISNGMALGIEMRGQSVIDAARKVAAETSRQAQAAASDVLRFSGSGRSAGGVAVPAGRQVNYGGVNIHTNDAAAVWAELQLKERLGVGVV